jgi:hypothetical protein
VSATNGVDNVLGKRPGIRHGRTAI